jgi:F-type H+-transporting ATPase subunit delta
LGRVPRAREIWDALRRLLAGVASREVTEATASDLLAIVRFLDTQPRLRSAFTDPAVEPDAKLALARGLFGSSVRSEAVEAFVHVATAGRIRPSELADAVEEVAAQMLLDAAEEAGTLTEAQDHLVTFATLATENAELRDALTNPAVETAAKRAIAGDLLTDRAEPHARTLLEHWIERDQARHLDKLVAATIAEAAARRGRVVADVRSAIELDGEQRRRIAERFESLVGQPVDLRVQVDPAVIGSLSVKIGDEVYDGTVKRQLERAADRLGV